MTWHQTAAEKPFGQRPEPAGSNLARLRVACDRASFLCGSTPWQRRTEEQRWQPAMFAVVEQVLSELGIEPNNHQRRSLAWLCDGEPEVVADVLDLIANAHRRTEEAR